jgi:Leucine rich repeat
MLDQDRFAFETPNVIDPGDAPPTPPLHSNTRVEATTTTTTTSPSRRWKNAEKLLTDLNELDHLTDNGDDTPYDPYHEDEEEEKKESYYDDNQQGHENVALYYDDDRQDALVRTTGDKPLMRRVPAAVVPLHNATRRWLWSPRVTDDESLPLSRNSSSVDSSLFWAARTQRNDDDDDDYYRFYSSMLRQQMKRRDVRLGLVMLLLVIVVVTSTTGRRRHVSSTGAVTFASPKQRKERIDQVLAFIEHYELSTHDDLVTRNSPQYLASLWMATADPEQVPVSLEEELNQVVLGQHPFVQRYVLVVFFFATAGATPVLQNTTKDNNIEGTAFGWTQTTANFLTATHECSWNIAVDMGFLQAGKPTKTSYGVGCNKDLLVDSIILPFNNLVHELPPKMKHLPYLSTVLLSHNKLSGDISDVLNVFQHDLLYLDISSNDISGTLPEDLGDLFSKLQVLALSNNQLRGSLPPSLGTMEELKTLAVDQNLLGGPLPGPLQYLNNLLYVYANDNMFTGDPNNRFFDNHVMIREIDVSQNQIANSFPEHLLQASNLQVLELSNNFFAGTLPATIEPNNVLLHLSLRDNNVSGTIPAAVSHLSSLQYLDLHGNAFEGYVPQLLGDLVELTTLSLGNNTGMFPQKIPGFLSDLVLLEDLSMPNMQLYGTIPNWMSRLSNLEFVDWSMNQLTGDIPLQVWQLPQLRVLLLHDNEFEGSIPEQAPASHELQVASFHYNKLSGDLSALCIHGGRIPGDAAATKPTLAILATDCDSRLRCDASCCPACCQANNTACFADLRYIPQPNVHNTRAYDPALLSTSAAAPLPTYTSEPEDLVDNFVYNPDGDDGPDTFGASDVDALVETKPENIAIMPNKGGD